MFSTRTWRLMALIAAIALVNALVLPALGQTEDDPIIDVIATDATASEEGLATGVITLTRTGDVSSALDVEYTVTGTATADDDYVALTGLATFGIGESDTTVTVTPIDDSDVEGNETVILTLEANVEYTIGDDDQATVTIVDNEPGVEVTATDSNATEEGTTTGEFTLTRTGDLTVPLDVDYTVTGTATGGVDYVALTGTASFAADESTAVVTVTPVDDTDVEGDETVILTIDANASYWIGDDDQATVTIVDNDEAPLPEVNVTATDNTATEEGTTTGLFTLTRTGDLSEALDVDYTVTGTATGGVDYVALTGTASFAADESSTVVTITPVDDTDMESDETVVLTIDSDADYTIGDDDQATVTIVDNDEAPLPEVNVTATDNTATEEGTTTGVFTLTRSGDLTDLLSVDYTVTGSATAGDYVALSGTAVFPAGSATAAVVITPIDDTTVEGDETVVLTIDSDADYTIGDDDQATVTIVDNDEADDDDDLEGPPAEFAIPFDKSDCKKDGWTEFDVFKNQGDCVSFVATKGKNPPALLGDMTVEEWLESLDS